MTQFTPFTHNFFESILSSIDSEDPVKANAWLDTLLDVIDLLPLEVLSKEVLTIAVNKAKDNQPVFSRLGSCQLVGKLGLKLEPLTIHEELVPLTQNLSQDVEWTVRATMCAQLPFLLRGLVKSIKDEKVRNTIKVVLSVLFELGDDEIEMVRLVVVETASSGLQYLDKELIQTLMVPWIQRFCQQSLKNEDKTLPMLAQHWARICQSMQSFLSSEDKEWFSNFFYGMTSLGSMQQASKDKPNMPDVVVDTDNGQKLEIYAEVRHACAVNSAPMVPFIGAENFIKRLASLRTLAADHYFVVRRAVAANILELCRQLQPYSGAMHPLLVSILIDPCVDVVCALVPQIGAVIECMSRLPAEHNPFSGGSESIAAETCEAVLRCEEQVMNGSLWRIQADMLSQLAAFPLCLPCHAIHDLLIPRLWHRIQTLRPLPCRVAAAQTLMLCVRSERRAKQRSALCADILNRLASADSCHRRMLFLRACPVLFDLLSRKFIRQHFFLPLVRMAGDKVANVRLRFATLLPRLHVSLRGLDVDKEKQLIVELDSAVRWLVETERDRDVKDELANFFRWVEDQERTMRTPEANQRLADDEAADKRKESEEKLIDDEDQGVVASAPIESQPQQQQPERTFFSGQTPDAAGQPLSQADERPVALDPEDFYRDAGVRLSSPSKTPRGESRVPPSRLRPPGHVGLSSRIVSSTAAALPQFSIARGVQQVAPQPSIATPVTPRRERKSAQLAAKSRSQENLTSSPRPKAPRPVSTCLAANDLLMASRQSPFNRTRLRASIGGTSRSSAPPPIATLPPSNSPAKWTAPRASPAKTGTVKLSDMKPALPLTRKSTPADFQFTRRRIEPSKLVAASSTTTKVTLEETTRLLESLEISPGSTRLRKPQTSIRNLADPMRVASPEPSPIQRRNPWRRSLNFSTATSSPPPPPPRKNFATLPRSATPAPSLSTSGSNNNNNNSANNNNNNGGNNTSNSKLPVPAFKRNSYLGSNI